MTSGIRRDGKPNPAARNIVNGRDRQNMRIIGLPSKLLTRPLEAQAEGAALVELIRTIEEQLTVWEDAQDIKYLEMLPWWPQRVEYRRLKALGQAPEVTWYEALLFLEESHPVGWDDEARWGLYRSPGRLAKRKRKQAGSS